VDQNIEKFDVELEDDAHEEGEKSVDPKTSLSRRITAGEEERFRFLWENRGQLEKDEQVELYMLAAAVLERVARGGKIKSLLVELAKTNPYELEDYIAEYLAHKIFESPGQDPLHHVGVLGIYFYRHLISAGRKHRPPRDSKPNANDDAITETQGIGLAELLKNDGEETDPAEKFHVNALYDAHALEKLEGLAKDFLTDLPRWARLYLRFHDGADDQDGKLPRKKLADKYGIPSYQLKAWELGVVIPPHAPKKDGRVDPDWYAQNTLLGRWLQEVVKIDLENRKQVLACFKILCELALKQVDETGELL
jgi:hypothetical protein